MPIGIVKWTVDLRRMFRIFTLCVFMCICADIGRSSGGAFYRESKVAKENGHEVHFCEWKGTRFLPVTDFKDYDSCVHCKCKKGMMSCNSIQETLFLSPSVEKESDCEPLQSHRPKQKLKKVCFGRWLYNGSVDGSHLYRSPNC